MKDDPLKWPSDFPPVKDYALYSLENIDRSVYTEPRQMQYHALPSMADSRQLDFWPAPKLTPKQLKELEREVDEALRRL